MNTALAASIFTLGGLAGFILRCVITSLANLRDRAPERPPVAWSRYRWDLQPRTRWSAKHVLPYYDFGTGWVLPVYPRGNHPTALAAWDTRNGRRT